MGKVAEKGMRKLNITEDMADNRHQWRQLISSLSGKLGTLNEDGDDDDDDDDDDYGDDDDDDDDDNGDDDDDKRNKSCYP